MLSKEEAKKKLKPLIEKFRQKEGEYKSLQEADVETKLIRELFVEILGWTNNDFFQQTKVTRGDKRGRADYEFRIGEKIVFYLEAKKVNVQLEKEADKQVVSYALSKKNVSFAISTNFRQLKIFCVEQENAVNQVFRVFSEPEEYLSKFEDLWLLSKQSFMENLLLKQAEKELRLKRRVSIDKYLLEDLMYVRKLISDDIGKKYADKYNINEKDEIVQRILDRLIFIRRCEDVGINPNGLMLNDLANSSEERAYSKLKEIFKTYDDKYNSGLFAVGEDNDCDKISISGGIIKKLIELLYQSRDKQYYYNFDWIDADVLGQVYEQYLGKILEQTKSGKAKLKEGQAHRKKQGIYYTPTYIVDYIVKNTIGEIIKENRYNTKNLKILDPACGSGSFLIKAFDYLYNELKDEEKSQKNLLTTDNLGFYSLKTQILKRNLFGVDLDHKAVEITKLNLLLKAAEKNRKLPEELDLHVRKGNSLIDDETITKDYFKWLEDFQEGSFDIVIGNPPYISFYSRMAQFLSKEEREFFSKKYSVVANPNARINSIQLFLEKAINLAKPGGYIGFIVDRTLLEEKNNQFIRDYILKNTSIVKIVPNIKKVFGVTVDVVIIILKKEKPKKDNKINWINNEDIQIKEEKLNVLQERFEKNNRKEFSFNETNEVERKFEMGQPIRDFVILKSGANIGGHSEEFLFSYKKTNKCKPVLKGSKNVEFYSIKWNSQDKNSYLNYDHDLQYSINKKAEKIDKNSKKKVNLVKLGDGHMDQRFEKPKIIIRQSSSRITATYDDSGYYLLYGLFLLNQKENSNISLKYILGLLNSNLFSYYAIKNKIILTGDKKQPQIRSEGLKRIKIKVSSEKEQQKIIFLVDRILEKNKQLVSFGDKQTSETKKLKDEIEQIDKEINSEVYKLYELTPEEIKIVEESLK